MLDEPTNHLDIWARSALEKALLEYEGTIVFVSHDRYFLDRVASRVLVLEPDRCSQYDGNYSNYLAFIKAMREEQSGVNRSGQESRNVVRPKEEGNGNSPRKRRKFPYRLVEEIEADIATCETRMADLQSEMGSPEVLRDGRKMKAIQEALESSRRALEELMEHWEEAMALN